MSRRLTRQNPSRRLKRSIHKPRLCPCGYDVLAGVFFCFNFIDVHPQAGLVIGIDIAVPEFRKSRKHIKQGLTEAFKFLNDKVQRLCARPQLAAVHAQADGDGAARRRSSVNLSNLAYERIEDLLVSCELKPGRFMATHDLQTLVEFGHTPVHQAVHRLATDALLIVTPRHGIQIAPIDLTRERLLLRLRRDMERFVIRLSTEHSGASQRNQMLHIRRQLIEHGVLMSIEQFNVIDRRIDQLLLTAANEPFVASTLRPLDTIFRRIGWIYHM